MRLTRIIVFTTNSLKDRESFHLFFVFQFIEMASIV